MENKTTEIAMENKTQAIATSNGMLDVVNIADLLVASTKLDALKPVVTLSSSYIELESVGSTFRGIYAGPTEIQTTDKETGELRTLPAVRFVVDKKIRVNAGAVLVSEIKRCAVNIGTPIEVKYTKKEGNVKIYELTLLG
jgi:hypothetical protein